MKELLNSGKFTETISYIYITGCIEEYEPFTWNSTYLCDKMRISLVRTRGELTNRNNGERSYKEILSYDMYNNLSMIHVYN